MTARLHGRTVEILRPRQFICPLTEGPRPRDEAPRRSSRRLADARRLADLISVGPAMVRDFEMLGIRSVAQLARQNPHRIYEKLGQIVGRCQDLCVLDTFCAAVAQARDPRLSAEKCQWWWWSRKRKSKANGSRSAASGRKRAAS